MSRYIDADAIENSIIEKWGVDPKYLDDSLDAMKDAQTLEWINSAPSIDIVRCKECKFENTRKCPPHRMGLIHEPDDFCSYGVKESE